MTEYPEFHLVEFVADCDEENFPLRCEFSGIDALIESDGNFRKLLEENEHVQQTLQSMMTGKISKEMREENPHLNDSIELIELHLINRLEMSKRQKERVVFYGPYVKYEPEKNRIEEEANGELRPILNIIAMVAFHTGSQKMLDAHDEGMKILGTSWDSESVGLDNGSEEVVEPLEVKQERLARDGCSEYSSSSDEVVEGESEKTSACTVPSSGPTQEVATAGTTVSVVPVEGDATVPMTVESAMQMEGVATAPATAPALATTTATATAPATVGTLPPRIVSSYGRNNAKKRKHQGHS